MLREIPMFGALAPSLLLYFIGAIVLFVIVDRVLAGLLVYRLLWNPPLARFALFLCVLFALVFSTRY